MKKYLAELVGTFVLTFLGCGAAVALGCGSDTASIVGTAMAFGLAVVVDTAEPTAVITTATGANACAFGVCNGLIVEIVLTCIFVLVVLGATSKTNGATNNFAGLAIGLSLILIHLVGIHFTGTSVNPARSIGPALFEGGDALSQLWVFIIGPLVGGACAAGIWKAIHPAKAQ